MAAIFCIVMARTCSCQNGFPVMFVRLNAVVQSISILTPYLLHSHDTIPTTPTLLVTRSLSTPMFRKPVSCLIE
ncbi:hypothetical protein B0H63DRAFT_124788 [Podospora didyma]|uniref:Uncharacterized protein n=1 Tax=Podospora didyma TaxID=330526 RepID=A0AAE0P047_9PEZI|nr:hypothetical protein B0H63DRAFT_124788 [Podospora didyma]